MAGGNVDEMERAKDVQGLITALEDPKGRVRQDAAKALGRIGDARAVEALTACLRDQEEAVRESACQALERISSRTPATSAQVIPPEAGKVPPVAADPAPQVMEDEVPFQVGDIVEPYREFTPGVFLQFLRTDLIGTKWKVLFIGPEDVSLQLFEGLRTELVQANGISTMVFHKPGYVMTVKNSDFYSQKYPQARPYQEVLDSFRKVG